MSYLFEKILVLLPWYSEHDAISNDAIWQTRYLRDAGFEAHLYAEGVSPKLADQLVSLQVVQELINNPTTLVIYHHGVHWIQGESILKQAQCRLVMKYHNITPADFYRPYDRIATFATEAGRNQTRDFLDQKIFHYIIADSQYNVEDLREYGISLPRTDVVAPFTQLSDFDRVESNSRVKAQLGTNGRFNILFVGRIVPNKGIFHLIEVVRQYIQYYGADIDLNIIGGLGLSEDKYFKEIEDKVNAARLANHIHFLSKIDFSEIKSYYENSDAFLLMSEHEGFCVPILEAQYMGLPLIALDRAAVGETIGHNQLLLSDINYGDFAASINRIKSDNVLREHLISLGQANAVRYGPKRLLTHLTTLLKSID